jgi:hypothetical protein
VFRQMSIQRCSLGLRVRQRQGEGREGQQHEVDGLHVHGEEGGDGLLLLHQDHGPSFFFFLDKYVSHVLEKMREQRDEEVLLVGEKEQGRVVDVAAAGEVEVDRLDRMSVPRETKEIVNKIMSLTNNYV